MFPNVLAKSLTEAVASKDGDIIIGVRDSHQEGENQAVIKTLGPNSETAHMILNSSLEEYGLSYPD